jgi:iron complex outermembrane receptor protein/vitamin B12 transporter
LVALVYLLLSLSSSCAQTSPTRLKAGAGTTRLETVEVVAEPVPAETLSGTHTMLDRETIQQSSAQDAAELLRMVGVVHMSQSGTKGALSTVSLRAAKPNFTLVLVNGVPVNDIGDLLGGAFNFATIDADEIESVDILRGPLSSVYGSEAVGGVLSITLRSPYAGPSWRAKSEAGNFAASASSAGVNFEHKKASGSVDGGFARMGEQVLNDGFLRGTAALQGAFELDRHKRLESFLRWNRLSSTGFPVSSGGPEYALSRLIEVDQADQIIGGAKLQHQANKSWFYTADYDLFSRVAMNDTPAIFDTIPPGPSYVPSTHSDSRFLRQRGLTVQRFQPARWIELDGVASCRDENGSSIGTMAVVLPASYALSRPTGFFSGNMTVNGKGFSATAGFGVEKSNTYHTVISPRVGASYFFGETRLRASWGQGFKLPSFYSLGNPLVGNPALTPEFSTGFDAAIEHHFAPARLNVALTGFNNSYRDLIDFSPSLFRLVNREAAFGRGGELEANGAIHRVTVGGSASYLDAGLKGTSERLTDVPRWSEDLHLQAPLSSRMQLGLATVWVGRRYDYQVPVPQRNTVGAYSVTNMKLTYRLRENFEGHLGAENLFDRKYQEFVGFPSPGIYFSAGLAFTAGAHGRAAHYRSGP